MQKSETSGFCTLLRNPKASFTMHYTVFVTIITLHHRSIKKGIFIITFKCLQHLRNICEGIFTYTLNTLLQ